MIFRFNFLTIQEVNFSNVEGNSVSHLREDCAFSWRAGSALAKATYIYLCSTTKYTPKNWTKIKIGVFFFFFNWGKCFRRRKFSVLGTCQFFSKKIPSSIPRLKKRWRYKSLYFLYLLHLVPISLIENASSFNLQEIQISTFQKFWTFSRVI